MKTAEEIAEDVFSPQRGEFNRYDLAEIIRQTREELSDEALKEIPNNWLDSLLTGPEAIVDKGLKETQLIERLFNAVRERIKAIENK